MSDYKEREDIVEEEKEEEDDFYYDEKSNCWRYKDSGEEAIALDDDSDSVLVFMRNSDQELQNTIKATEKDIRPKWLKRQQDLKAAGKEYEKKIDDPEWVQKYLDMEID